MKVTMRWKTICTVCFRGAVDALKENPAAHGNVCHFQVRKNAFGEVLGRKVNSNGSHREVGKAFLIDDATLARWESLNSL